MIDNYNVDFDCPITLQGIDRYGIPKVVLLNKEHLDCIVEIERKKSINKVLDSGINTKENK